ncbi:AraC family transcriptional regulator [Caballeronia hypogeia]|uniref:AraC family transcriptional regulator n=1 Tax=Caballeronia hypogeia TaxID=1777140 RepID=A0A158CDK0_9BURK|nr:AraC family transcriptional regulator [Caballeronia hypogeia]SAK80331.1 AraC family transcriptional regulator [Caballeronia hypogeia]
MSALAAPSAPAMPTVPGAAIRIDRFSAVAGAPGLEYCISGPKPYSLELSNSSDMICLLLGTIVSDTRYDDGPAAPFTFRAETAAYHPRGERIRIDAHDVRHGFIAFRYAEAFVDRIAAHGTEPVRRAGSRSNLGADSIRHLVRYARQKAPGRQGRVDPWEMQCVATLAWIETTRHLGRPARERKSTLTDAGFARLEAYVADNIEQSLSCADIAAELNLPVRAVFDGVKARTGHSLYRFVLEKRIGVAAQMLRSGDAPLVEVAAACGFSSQQHMTALFSGRLGVTPLRYRNGAA